MSQAGYHQCDLPRGKDSAGDFHDTDGMVRSLTLGTDTTSWGSCETVGGTYLTSEPVSSL